MTPTITLSGGLLVNFTKRLNNVDLSAGTVSEFIHDNEHFGSKISFENLVSLKKTLGDLLKEIKSYGGYRKPSPTVLDMSVTLSLMDFKVLEALERDNLKE